MLTALLGNTNDELRESDFDYRHILLQAYKTHDTANRAKIAAGDEPGDVPAGSAKPKTPKTSAWK